MPTTYIWGRHDPFLGRFAAEATADYVVGRYRLVELHANALITIGMCRYLAGEPDGLVDLNEATAELKTVPDSLYREARELLNRGDWRKAATPAAVRARMGQYRGPGDEEYDSISGWFRNLTSGVMVCSVQAMP